MDDGTQRLTRPKVAPPPAPKATWLADARRSCAIRDRRTPSRSSTREVIFSGGISPIRPSLLKPNMAALIAIVANAPAAAPSRTSAPTLPVASSLDIPASTLVDIVA